MAIRFGRATDSTWHKSRPRMRDVMRRFRQRAGRIMFPTSHDITPDNLDHCLTVLRAMLAPGNNVLIVSKPFLPCIEAICREFTLHRPQILYRFTIGSADESRLRYWEPNAPRFEERLNALKHAYHAGFATSISCEPMLDPNVGTLIEAVRPFVTDSIWLGRANRLRQTISLNCPGDREARRAATELLSQQPDAYLRKLYHHYNDDPLIKFKDSIKKAVGLERPTERGLDV